MAGCQMEATAKLYSTASRAWFPGSPAAWIKHGTGWNWMELDGTGWNWMELDGCMYVQHGSSWGDELTMNY